MESSDVVVCGSKRKDGSEGSLVKIPELRELQVRIQGPVACDADVRPFEVFVWG